MDGNNLKHPNGAYKTGEMLLYKLDRTLAIAGIVAIGVCALLWGEKEIAVACAGGLATYIGVKGGK